MSTTTHPATTPARPGSRAVPEPIPFGRVVGVEMRKTFDTRAGTWLLASIGIVAVLATAAVMLWAPDDALTFETFGSAVGTPMAVLLPVVSILLVTGEWSQRSGLTTFTLVPRRGRTIAAKAVVTTIIGVCAMALALVVALGGAYLGPALRGTEPVIDLTVGQVGTLVLAQVLGMFVGFMLGLVTRSSAVALVAYFVFWVSCRPSASCCTRRRTGTATSWAGSTSAGPTVRSTRAGSRPPNGRSWGSPGRCGCSCPPSPDCGS